MAENDISNFSSSSPHRLPTLSASAVLQNLISSSSEQVSTGLPRLDTFLQRHEADALSQVVVNGGLTRGHVTEVYGPPGVGKSTFAWHIEWKCAEVPYVQAILWCGWVSIALAVESVSPFPDLVLADCAHPVAGARLQDIVLRPNTEESVPATLSSPRGDEILEGLHHFTTPTLPHLLALLTHGSASFPPKRASLIVIEAVSSLFNLAFPKAFGRARDKQNSSTVNDPVQWAASRRWAVMGDFISKIGKLAATKNLAICLTMQTTTRVRADIETCLYPAIAGTVWDNGIHARIILFRDWLLKPATPSNQGSYETGSRCAVVVKAGGVSYEGLGKMAPFKITKHGFEAINAEQVDIRVNGTAAVLGPALKRKRDEVSSSQSDDGTIGSDEEFGWTGDYNMTIGDEETSVPEAVTAENSN